MGLTICAPLPLHTADALHPSEQNRYFSDIVEIFILSVYKTILLRYICASLVPYCQTGVIEMYSFSQKKPC